MKGSWHAGAGKTYTMEGTREDPGINYRTMKELFRYELHFSGSLNKERLSQCLDACAALPWLATLSIWAIDADGALPCDRRCIQEEREGGSTHDITASIAEIYNEQV